MPVSWVLSFAFPGAFSLDHSGSLQRFTGAILHLVNVSGAQVSQGTVVCSIIGDVKERAMQTWK